MNPVITIAAQYATVLENVKIYHNPLQRAIRLIDLRITELLADTQRATAWLRNQKIVCLSSLRQKLVETYRDAPTRLPAALVAQLTVKEQAWLKVGIISHKSSALLTILENIQRAEDYIIERDAARLVCEDLKTKLQRESKDNDSTKEQKIAALSLLITKITDKNQFHKSISTLVAEFKQTDKASYDHLKAGLNNPRGKQLLTLLETLKTKDAENTSRISFERMPALT